MLFLEWYKAELKVFEIWQGTEFLSIFLVRYRETKLGIGTTELIIIGGIVFLLFGAKRLPQIGGSMAKAIKNFQQGMKSGGEDSAEEKSSDSIENSDTKDA